MAAKYNFIFRRAKREDMEIVRKMIQELADFENMTDGPKLTEKDLIEDSGLEGGRDSCHIYLLELIDEKNSEKLAIGYAICFFAYSTWQGKSYFLEDIYVRPQYRGIGAGERIFREVALKAKEFNCKRVDFHVLAWNPARKFYEKMGAIDLTESEEWHYYRLSLSQIEHLANGLQVP